MEALAEEGYMGRVIELLQDFIEGWRPRRGALTQEECRAGYGHRAAEGLFMRMVILTSKRTLLGSSADG